MITSFVLSLLLLSLLLLMTALSPLTLGCSIFILTLLLCCVSSVYTLSWFTLILFLIYIGGLLVMFAYFVALSPNQYHKFFLSAPLLASVLSITFMLTFFYQPLYMNSPLSLSHLQTLPVLFFYQNFLLLMFAAFTLFLTLLAVVKTVSLPFGPLRPFLST